MFIHLLQLFWILMTCSILLYYYVSNWDDDIEEELKNGETGLKANAEILTKEQFKMALIAHTSLCMLYIPDIAFLVIGLQRKSRCLIVSWMVTSSLIGISRVIVFIQLDLAFKWLRYFELYWIPKSFFFAIAAMYCIELWGHQEDGEYVDHPIPYSLAEDDARELRGGHNYPESPITLDVRETIVGPEVGSTVLRDETLYKEYPMSYDALHYDGKGVRVVDHPPYEHL